MDVASVLGVVMPIVLLVFAFLLKLLIDRSATVPNVVRSVFELPVDVAFLAMTFVVAFTLGAPEHSTVGLFFFMLYIVGSILVVLLWRRSERCYEQNHRWRAGVIAACNYLLCTFGTVLAIRLVLPGGAS